MEKYGRLEQVGEGTYGKLYKAKGRETGKFVALKKTKLDMVKEGIPSNTLREISFHQILSKSDYVVRLVLGVEPVVPSPVSAKSSLYLVFEYIETDLKRFINSHSEGAGPKPLDPSLIQKLMFQLVSNLVNFCLKINSPTLPLRLCVGLPLKGKETGMVALFMGHGLDRIKK